MNNLINSVLIELMLTNKEAVLVITSLIVLLDEDEVDTLEALEDAEGAEAAEAAESEYMGEVGNIGAKDDAEGDIKSNVLCKSVDEVVDMFNWGSGTGRTIIIEFKESIQDIREHIISEISKGEVPMPFWFWGGESSLRELKLFFMLVRILA